MKMCRKPDLYFRLFWQQHEGWVEGAQFRKQANKLGNSEVMGIAKETGVRKQEWEPSTQVLMDHLAVMSCVLL